MAKSLETQKLEEKIRINIPLNKSGCLSIIENDRHLDMR